MQGLRTADWQFEDKGVYFERVLGVMFDLPVRRRARSTYVWACEVLHHNHRANLDAHAAGGLPRPRARRRS